MQSEAVYQAKLIKKLERLFPGCHVVKNNPAHTQGIPDLLILIENQWAALEVKASINAPHQPNQEYHVNKLDGMGFASFICPETEEDVLNELRAALGLRR